MKNRYLICLDLDETILKKNKTIGWKTKLYLRKMIRKGQYVVINTGRPYQSALKFSKMIGLKDMPIISSNGTNISYFDKKYNLVNEEIFSFDINELKKLYIDIKEYLVGFHVSYLSKNILLKDGYNPFWILHPEAGIESYFYFDLDNYMENNPLLSNVYINKKDEKKVVDILQNSQFKSFKYRTWYLQNDIVSFEIFGSDASKGNAMLYLASKLGISTDNIYAFGDQNNDIDMLEKAFKGVYMINSPKHILEHAKFITYKDNNHDGVVDYLRKEKL